MESKMQVKTLLLHEARTMAWLVERLNERTDRKYSRQSFSNRLNAGHLRYDEVLLIADILGYDIAFNRKE